MRPISFTYAPTASDDDAVANAQTTAGAAYLTINGANASGGVATLGDQQHLLLTTTSDVSLVNITITGRDKAGNPISTTTTLPNATTKEITKNFYQVETAYVDAAVAASMKIGVNGKGESQPFPLDQYLTPFQVAFAVQSVANGETYKGQYTYDNVFASSFPNGTQNWVDSAGMTGKTAAFTENYTAPVAAVRISITTPASSQSISGRIVQAGGGL